MTRRALCALGALLLAAPVAAQTIAITGGTVVVGDGTRMANATVVIVDGRIQAVGQNVAVPQGARTFDARGRFVYPGLINSRTTLGLTEIGSVAGGEDESEQPDYGPAFAAAIAVNPHSELIPVTRVNGVTTVMTGPQGGRISGMAALMDLEGWTPNQMARRRLAGLVINWPSLEGGGGGFGGGGGGGGSPAEVRRRGERQIWELEEFFRTAISYDQRADRGAVPDPDRQLDAMRPVVSGEVPVLIDADTPEQIRGAIGFADEFDLRLVILGGREAWKVRDTLAARNVPVILGSILSSPRTSEPFDAIYAQPAVLARAGVRIAFATWDASNARNLPYHAQMAMAHGLDADTALMAMTSWPAALWGVADEIGTIEAGKVANLFITSGEPMDVRSTVDQVFIRGVPISMANRHADLYEEFRGRPGK